MGRYKTKREAQKAADKLAAKGYGVEIFPQHVVGGAFGSPAIKPGLYWFTKHRKL